jgi:ABC-type phosphate/phosphonate transport system substrate-binding protein
MSKDLILAPGYAPGRLHVSWLQSAGWRISLLPRLLLIGLFVLCTSLPAVAAEKVYRVGVTAFRDNAVTVREWGPTMDFLSAQIPGARFEVVPLNLSGFEAALSRRELDFVLTNPQHYIVMETRYGVSRIATLVKQENGRMVNQFGGVIFTRSDRHEINRLQDLRDLRIAAVDRTSFAGFLLQYDIFERAGIDLDEDCHVQFLGFPQDLVVKAVLEGRADAGFVRTGVLEAMASEGHMTLSQVRILNPVGNTEFPFMISTELFPEWPLATAPHVSIEITNRVAAALLLMPPDSPAARAARYYRWSTPLEYQRVQTMMRRHAIYPYDQREPIAVADVLREYAFHLLGGVVVFTLSLGVLYVRTDRLNMALQSSRQKLSEMAHTDALTGLPNRNLLDDRLALALAHARRSHERIAVCLIDLDRFKPINDTWGHEVGDEVLREVASRLEAVLREGDTVARLFSSVVLPETVAYPMLAGAWFPSAGSPAG